MVGRSTGDAEGEGRVLLWLCYWGVSSCVPKGLAGRMGGWEVCLRGGVRSGNAGMRVRRTDGMVNVESVVKKQRLSPVRYSEGPAYRLRPEDVLILACRNWLWQAMVRGLQKPTGFCFIRGYQASKNRGKEVASITRRKEARPRLLVYMGKALLVPSSAGGVWTLNLGQMAGCGPRTSGHVVRIERFACCLG